MASPRVLLGLAFLGASVCAGCGSSFTGSSDSTNGDAGAGATSEGGSSAIAGSDSGGTAGEASAGTAGVNGGSTSSGGTGASAGSGGSSAGAGTGGTGHGGSGGTVSTGGNAGSGGNAGTGGMPDCKTLQAEYATLLAKARVCDQGSTDQCSPSSTLPGSGACGCPTLVNAKSEATSLAQKKYKQLQDNKCLSGAICNIACVSTMAASCQQQTSGMGSSYQCMAAAPLIN